jgi:hypothetical protein
VTITSQDEYDFLITTFGKASFWTAASDGQREGTWIWTAGPETGVEVEVPESFWLQGQPSGGNTDNCVAMSPNWDDKNCTNFTTGFVIEYECQSTNTSTCPCMSYLFIFYHYYFWPTCF